MTTSSKAATAFAIAAAIAAGALAVSSTAEARTHYRHLARPHQRVVTPYNAGYGSGPGPVGGADLRRQYGGFAGPYPRNPIYNPHDRYRTSRELVGTGGQ